MLYCQELGCIIKLNHLTLSSIVGPTSVSTQSDGGITTIKGSTRAGDGETNPGPCTDKTHFHDCREPNAQVITSRSIMNNTNSTMREMRRGTKATPLSYTLF